MLCSMGCILSNEISFLMCGERHLNSLTRSTLSVRFCALPSRTHSTPLPLSFKRLSVVVVAGSAIVRQERHTASHRHQDGQPLLQIQVRTQSFRPTRRHAFKHTSKIFPHSHYVNRVQMQPLCARVRPSKQTFDEIFVKVFTHTVSGMTIKTKGDI